ncbi:MAG: hypothetical protein LBQ69_00185 [Treponema sp.]|jgi:hypothetical protein|nr:hypothetical protein [Treponema sp.]
MGTISFSKSKYVNPYELANFSNVLKQTIVQLQNALHITPQNRNYGPLVIEAWPLVQHITCGEYLRYTNPASQQAVDLWIGLDLVEEGIALVVWFDSPNPAVIAYLFTLRNTGCCGEFGRYQRGKIDQAWITLDDMSFDQFLSNPGQEPQIIENFLWKVLQGL